MARKSAKILGSGQRNRWLNRLEPNVVKLEPGKLRVLVDTNVWYSAILYGGKPEEVGTICRQRYQLVSSQYIVDELLTLLKEVGTPYRWRNNLEKVLKRIMLLVEPPDFSGISRDPKDDPIISAAITGKCDFLITNDKDLLELGVHNELHILKSADFLLHGSSQE